MIYIIFIIKMLYHFILFGLVKIFIKVETKSLNPSGIMQIVNVTANCYVSIVK